MLSTEQYAEIGKLIIFESSRNRRFSRIIDRLPIAPSIIAVVNQRPIVKLTFIQKIKKYFKL